MYWPFLTPRMVLTIDKILTFNILCFSISNPYAKPILLLQAISELIIVKFVANTIMSLSSWKTLWCERKLPLLEANLCPGYVSEANYHSEGSDRWQSQQNGHKNGQWIQHTQQQASLMTLFHLLCNITYNIKDTFKRSNLISVVAAAVLATRKSQNYCEIIWTWCD